MNELCVLQRHNASTVIISYTTKEASCVIVNTTIIIIARCKVNTR